MDWVQIREHYRREFDAAKKQRRLTQKQVAEAGGLSGQNVISKLLQNENQGPAAEIVVNAIEGLGLSVSEFFARLERRARGEQGDDIVLQGSFAKKTALQARPGKAFILATIVEALERAQEPSHAPTKHKAKKR